MAKILVLSFLLGASAFASQDCGLTKEILEKNLKLSWSEFDQTMGAGHRELAIKGCPLEAAILVDIYSVQNQDQIDPSKLRALYFHAGQHYAYAELNLVAAARMIKAFNPGENLSPDLNWNDYVQASVAFLKSDKPALLIFREKISAGKKTPGNTMNLGVVDNLIKCFGRPYSWAFEQNHLCK